MNLDKKYAKIEKTFLKYADTCRICATDPVTDAEDFVRLPIEMVDPRCVAPVLRKTVAEKLMMADRWLRSKNPNLRIVVYDAYRSPKIQSQKFAEVYARIKPKMRGATEMEILEKCHEQIAVPDVAGHPTGGAVDVAIYDMRVNDIVDFGTGYCEWDAGRRLYFASPQISAVARRNRKLLRKAMVKQGFLQYMAEWWHFSYGDKEWAVANGKPMALYSQKIE